MRDLFTEFQHGMREVLRSSVIETVRTILQTQQQVQRPVLPHREEIVSEDEDDEEDVLDNNPFA